MFLPVGPAAAENERISRFEFVSAVYERVYNRKLTELEVVNSGLIDAFGTNHQTFNPTFAPGSSGEAWASAARLVRARHGGARPD